MEKVPPGEDTAGYWLRMGSNLANSGRYIEAAKALDRSIELDPNDTEAWNNRGIVLSILKRNKEAIQSFEKATAIDPRNAEAWYNRGMVFCSLDRYEDAVESLEKALEIDPQSAIAWHNKGVALKLLGRIPRPGSLLHVQEESGPAKSKACRISFEAKTKGIFFTRRL